MCALSCVVVSELLEWFTTRGWKWSSRLPSSGSSFLLVFFTSLILKFALMSILISLVDYLIQHNLNVKLLAVVGILTLLHLALPPKLMVRRSSQHYSVLLLSVLIPSSSPPQVIATLRQKEHQLLSLEHFPFLFLQKYFQMISKI
jgi:hypothetical protein